MSVWIVSVEWNFPALEVTGAPGICGVYSTSEAAEIRAAAERKSYDEDGQQVHAFSMADGRYCGACGELTKECHCSGAAERTAFCHQCGAETNANESCDNDHDEWDIDVHVTEHQINGAGPDATS